MRCSDSWIFDSAASDTLERGIVLANRYRIDGLLGEGGMGVVYRGLDLRSHENVAIKLLRRGDAKAVARFKREGVIAAAITAPGLVSVLAAGQEGDQAFLIYELVENAQGLGEALAEEDQDGCLEAFTDIALILSEVHAKGIVHRDLKLENIVVDGTGRPWLLDFGVAWSPELDTLTASSDSVGTPIYMAPEQITGGHVDVGPPTDIWAFGVMLYRFFCGRYPFEATTAVELASKIALRNPEPPRKLDPQIPAPLDAVILKCLSKSPEERYQDGGELFAELERLCLGRSVSAVPAPFHRRQLQLLGRLLGPGGLLLLIGGLLLISLTLVFLSARTRQRRATQAWTNDVQLQRRALASMVEAGHPSSLRHLGAHLAPDQANFPANSCADPKKLRDQLRRLEAALSRSPSPRLHAAAILNRKGLNWHKALQRSASFLIALESPPGPPSQALHVEPWERTYLDARQSLLQNDLPGAARLFRKLKQQEGRWRLLSSLGDALVAMRSGRWLEASGLLAELNQAQTLPNLSQRLLSEGRLGRSAERCVDLREPTVGLERSLRIFTADDLRQYGEQRFWRRWNPLLAQAFRRRQHQSLTERAKIFERLVELRHRFAGLSLPPIALSLRLTLARRAGHAGRIVDAIYHYHMARVANARVSIPRAYSLARLLFLSAEKTGRGPYLLRLLTWCHESARRGVIFPVPSIVLSSLSGSQARAALKAVPNEPSAALLRALFGLDEFGADKAFSRSRILPELIANVELAADKLAGPLRAEAIFLQVRAAKILGGNAPKSWPQEPQAAAAALKKALELNPPAPDALLYTLGFLWRTIDKEKALAAFQAAERSLENRYTRTNAGSLDEGRPNAACLAPIGRIQRNKRRASCMRLSAELLIELHRSPEAVALSKQSVSLDESDYSLGKHGALLVRAGRLRAARVIYQRRFPQPPSPIFKAFKRLYEAAIARQKHP